MGFVTATWCYFGNTEPQSDYNSVALFLNRVLTQCLVKHVVHLVVAECLLEVGDVGLLVDLDILDAQHLGEVLPVLLVDVVGEG